MNDEIRALKVALDTAESQRGVRASPDADSTATGDLTSPIKQTPEKRIVCAIDVDEATFCVELFTKGKEGGRLAARQLAESIRFHLTSDQPCHLWTYVYFNRHIYYSMRKRQRAELARQRAKCYMNLSRALISQTNGSL